MDERFSALFLATLREAEDLAPWGESARTLRMLYLANSMIAASDGYKDESRRQASARAQRILVRLTGPIPESRRPAARDFRGREER